MEERETVTEKNQVLRVSRDVARLGRETLRLRDTMVENLLKSPKAEPHQYRRSIEFSQRPVINNLHTLYKEKQKFGDDHATEYVYLYKHSNNLCEPLNICRTPLSVVKRSKSCLNECSSCSKDNKQKDKEEKKRSLSLNHSNKVQPSVEDDDEEEEEEDGWFGLLLNNRYEDGQCLVVDASSLKIQLPPRFTEYCNVDGPRGRNNAQKMSPKNLNPLQSWNNHSPKNYNYEATGCALSQEYSLPGTGSLITRRRGSNSARRQSARSPRHRIRHAQTPPRNLDNASSKTSTLAVFTANGELSPGKFGKGMDRRGAGVVGCASAHAVSKHASLSSWGDCGEISMSRNATESRSSMSASEMERAALKQKAAPLTKDGASYDDLDMISAKGNTSQAQSNRKRQDPGFKILGTGLYRYEGKKKASSPMGSLKNDNETAETAEKGHVQDVMMVPQNDENNSRRMVLLKKLGKIFQNPFTRRRKYNVSDKEELKDNLLTPKPRKDRKSVFRIMSKL